MRNSINLLLVLAFAGTIAFGCQSPLDDKKSSNADLKVLEVDSGTLNPVFSPAVTEYTATVPHRVTTVTVRGTKADAGATLTGPVTLAPLVADAPRAAKLTVTAANGATKTYTVTVTRAPVPTVAPAAPTGLTAGTTTGNTVKLTWSHSATAVTYSLYRSLLTSGTFTLVQSGITEPAFTDTEGLTANQTYYYQVSATNEAGEGGKGATATALTKALSGALLGAPAGLAAEASAIDSVSLSWNVLDGASGYRVYRATSTGGPFQVLTAEPTTTRFIDAGLSPATTYYYKVAGFNTNGQGASSVAASAKTKSPSLPVAPSGITVGSATTTTLTISWDAVAQAAGYRVFRATAANGPYTKVGTDTTETGYNDTGLTASTTYFYRVAAYNVTGEGPQSAGVAGTTASPLAAPSALTVTSTTANTIQLSWTAAPSATSYKIYRSASSGGVFTLLSSAEFVSPFTDTDLSSETTYYYQISSVSDGLESPKGTAVEAKTKGASAALLSAPTGLKATGTTTSEIQLQWTSLTGAKGYRLYRYSNAAGGYRRIGSDLSSTTYTDSGLTAGTTYTYRLAAFDDNGQGAKTSGYTKPTTATTLPSAPTGLSIALSADTALTLSWAVVEGATGYRLYMASSAAGPFTEVLAGLVGSSTASVPNLSPLTTYYFQVLAVNAIGESPRSATASGKTTAAAPAIPSGLTVTNATSTSLTLTWSASPGAVGYRLYRASSISGSYGRVGETQTTPSFTDATLTASTTYYYIVTAYNTEAESVPSASISGTTSAALATVPSVPTGLSVGTPATTSLPLSWNSVTNATGYRVYRSSTSNGTYTKVGADQSTTSYSDTGLTADTIYYYKVAAFNTAGESAQSSATMGRTTVLTTVPSVPIGFSTGADTTSLALSWTPAGNATGYRLYRSTTSAGTYTKLGGDLTKTSYTDTGLSSNTTYYYKVSAFNATGESAQSTAFSGKTTVLAILPSVPTGLSVGTPDTTSLPLSWTSVTNADGYRVYRSTTSSGTYTQLGDDLSATSYTDTGLSADTTYYYKVSAFNAEGESAQSAAATGKTSVAVAAKKYRMVSQKGYDASGNLISDIRQTFVAGTGLVDTQTSYASGSISGKSTSTYVAGTEKVSRIDSTTYLSGKTYTSSMVYTYTTPTIPNTTAYSITTSGDFGAGFTSTKADYVFDAQGRILEAIGYDAAGQKSTKVTTTSSSASEFVQKSYTYAKGVETLSGTTTSTYSGNKLLKQVTNSTTQTGTYTITIQSTTTFTYTGDLITEMKGVSYTTITPALAGYPLTTTSIVRMTYDANGNQTKQVSLDGTGKTVGSIEMVWEAY